MSYRTLLTGRALGRRVEATITTTPADAPQGPVQVAIETMISVAQFGHKDAMRNVIDTPESPIAAQRPATANSPKSA